MNGGDQLARGARSATFGPPDVTQEKWDAIWSQDEHENKVDLLHAKAIYRTKNKNLTKPPLHCGENIEVENGE